MAGSGKKSSDALLAAALARGDTIARAAKACGVGERTVSRRKQDPEFASLVRQLRADMADSLAGVLASNAADAGSVLAKLAKGKDKRLALEAAKAVIDRHFKAREQGDLAEEMRGVIEQLKAAGVLT